MMRRFGYLEGRGAGEEENQAIDGDHADDFSYWTGHLLVSQNQQLSIGSFPNNGGGTLRLQSQKDAAREKTGNQRQDEPVQSIAGRINALVRENIR